MYYNDTSDDEDPLPVQSLEFTVNNNQEQNNDYSTCILVDLLDREIVKKTEEEGKKLGICMQHFNVDQKYHKNKLKTTIPVIDKNVQVPCNEQITCHALNNFGVICKPEVGIVTKAQYICCECYQNHGGHLHVKMGSGKSLFDCEKFGLHNSDHSTSFDLLETQEMEAKNSSSKAVIEILTISDLLYTKVPSPFVLKVFLKMYKKKLEDTNSFSLNEQSKTFGQNMAKTLWNSQTMLLEQKNKIKMPDSLNEYYNALAPFLTSESAINLFDKLLVTSLQMTIENDVIKYQKDFDASTIYQKMMKCVEHECNYSPGTPNKDAGVFESVDMYYNDYEINQEDYIDIVADESIFT
nr:1366_t:CDS:2 [Entrophospora candida]